MTKKLTEWPFENGQTDKVGPSDGCQWNAVPLATESKYDFRELGAYLGNFGLIVQMISVIVLLRAFRAQVSG